MVSLTPAPAVLDSSTRESPEMREPDAMLHHTPDDEMFDLKESDDESDPDDSHV
jgi:hypothetical protein